MRTIEQTLNLRETIELARRADAAELDNLIHHRSPEVMETVIENPSLTERHLLILLARRNLTREMIIRIAANPRWMSSYHLKVAVLKHRRTPRHVALPLLKFVYLFDLLAMAMGPGVAPDLKRIAEDAILSQTEGIALGQRISLARRGSLRIASSLLNDAHRRVVDAALSNPMLTEQAVAAALLVKDPCLQLTEAVMGHARWAVGRLIRLALLRNTHLTLAGVMKILSELTTEELSNVVADKRVPASIRLYASRTVQAGRNRKTATTRIAEEL